MQFSKLNEIIKYLPDFKNKSLLQSWSFVLSVNIKIYVSPIDKDCSQTSKGVLKFTFYWLHIS